MPINKTMRREQTNIQPMDTFGLLALISALMITFMLYLLFWA